MAYLWQSYLNTGKAVKIRCMVLTLSQVRKGEMYGLHLYKHFCPSLFGVASDPKYNTHSRWEKEKKINPCNFSFSLATDIIPYTSASSNFLTYPVSGQYSGKFLLLFFTVSFKHLGNSQPNKVLSEAQPRFVQRQSKVIRNKPYQDLYLEWKNS